MDVIKMPASSLLKLVRWLLMAAVIAPHAAYGAEEKPNFLLIVADDMGWSDPGFLGSRISTPNIDRLANDGIFFSQYYVAPTCSPTRAMLMTGLSNHAAGLGAMHNLQAPNQLDHVEYGAQLHDGVVTIAESLQTGGYATFHSGKWHLAIDEEQYPNRRGFDRSFGLIQGGASHFADRRRIDRNSAVEYVEDGTPVKLHDDFYSTKHYTDKMIDYIDSAGNRPFFAYLSYTAPHDPLQVPEDWLDHYAGKFNDGPIAEKQERIRRLVELGLLDESNVVSDAINFPKWLDLYKAPWEKRSKEEQKMDARRMELYAAMVELLDLHIGRLLDHLEKKGLLNNTYVIFMSDNGASAGTPFTNPGNDRNWVQQHFDLSYENMGRLGSFTTAGREWANNSNTPFRLYKASQAEGGIRSALIVRGPSIGGQQINRTPVHVSDIAPTLQALAGIDPKTQATYRGKLQPTGQSLDPLLRGSVDFQPRAIMGELFDHRMIRDGRWKAVSLSLPFGNGEWALYDVEADPSETMNLAGQYPDVLASLEQSYEKFAESNGVIRRSEPLLSAPIRLYEGPCDSWCRTKFKAAEILVDPRQRLVALVILLSLVTLLIGWQLSRYLAYRGHQSIRRIPEASR